MHGTEGDTIEPPAAMLYAVLPVGELKKERKRDVEKQRAMEKRT